MCRSRQGSGPRAFGDALNALSTLHESPCQLLRRDWHVQGRVKQATEQPLAPRTAQISRGRHVPRTARTSRGKHVPRTAQIQRRRHVPRTRDPWADVIRASSRQGARRSQKRMCQGCNVTQGSQGSRRATGHPPRPHQGALGVELG